MMSDYLRDHLEKHEVHEEQNKDEICNDRRFLLNVHHSFCVLLIIMT